MDKLLILENFHVFIARAGDAEGPETEAYFAKGMVVKVDDVPAGHSADGWIDKGLARFATPGHSDDAETAAA